eukprot:6799267-Pyramimonas_sp.AAC.1
MTVTREPVVLHIRHPRPRHNLLRNNATRAPGRGLGAGGGKGLEMAGPRRRRLLSDVAGEPRLNGDPRRLRRPPRGPAPQTRPRQIGVQLSRARVVITVS